MDLLGFFLCHCIKADNSSLPEFPTGMQVYRCCRNCLQPALILLLLEGAGGAGFLPSLGHFCWVPVKCDKAKSLLLKLWRWIYVLISWEHDSYPSSAISAPVPMRELRINVAWSSLLPRTDSGLELNFWRIWVTAFPDISCPEPGFFCLFVLEGFFF